PRHGGPVGRAVARHAQIAQQRLLGHAHADPLHALIVPRPLHREQAEQAAAQGRTGARRDAHRSHATAAPLTTPAANQRRSGPRPTSRSVPAVPAARAPPTAATSSSITPRGLIVPARKVLTSSARPRTSAVT